jgi:hypothetical protein
MASLDYISTWATSARDRLLTGQMLGDESCAFDGKKESPYFLTLHATHERGTRLRVKRCPFARCPGRLGASIVEVVTLGQTNLGPTYYESYTPGMPEKLAG